MSYSLSLPFAYGSPDLAGVLRVESEDFYVEEQLGFSPSGEGEHVFLWLEKKNTNTQFAAKQIAKLANVAEKYVSYSGMKDRRAVTRQWFSVHLPGKERPDWQQLDDDNISVLQCVRHQRKLRRGVHRGNFFRITAKNIQGDTNGLAKKIEQIKIQGVPNYFGEQRFGIQGRNLDQAIKWFSREIKPRRQQQGIYLSAARAFLFNQIIAQRVIDNTWLQVLPGELLMLAGTNSIFENIEEDNEILQQRIAEGDIHTTGLLFGRSKQQHQHSVLSKLEDQVLERHPQLVSGLEQAGLKAERRALRVIPENLRYDLGEDTVEITFSLPSGCFATAVMRELLQYEVVTEAYDNN